MAAQAYSPDVDPEDPLRGRQRLLQATTATGWEGARGEALYTAMYWAQGSPHGRVTPEPSVAWVMQAKAKRQYHLHKPFGGSPPAVPWPTDPPETVQKLADLTKYQAKASMPTSAEPPVLDPISTSYPPRSRSPPTSGPNKEYTQEARHARL